MEYSRRAFITTMYDRSCDVTEFLLIKYNRVASVETWLDTRGALEMTKMITSDS